MIHIRDFKRGLPESERTVLCGEQAEDCASANGCLDWWRARAEICPLCWDEWKRIVGVLGDAP